MTILAQRESTNVVNFNKLICDCKLRICIAYKNGGDSHALVAVACSSILLQAYVEAGSLRQSALANIGHTAHALGMHRRLGTKVVFTALHAGMLLYDDLAYAWEYQQRRTSRPLRRAA